MEEFLCLYICQHIICLSTRSAKIWWGIWVFGLHEKITSSDPGTTYQAPYLLLLDDVVVDVKETMARYCARWQAMWQ